MPLVRRGWIDLPDHRGSGGFDHAAVDAARGLLYVAHTANAEVDLIDTEGEAFLGSVGELPAVAGALTADDRDLVFTSNRGEDTVALLEGGPTPRVAAKIAVGARPNGLAYAPGPGVLLVANVGDPARGRPPSVDLIGVDDRRVVGSLVMPGRTRWCVWDEAAGVFYLNIADPAEVAVIEPGSKPQVVQRRAVPALGPHGLDLDPVGRRLFCACDGGALFAFDLTSLRLAWRSDLAGAPDVIFFNRQANRVYVAEGDGLIEVFDAISGRRLEQVTTEAGAHTMGFDARRQKIYALCPGSHRALVFTESPAP